MLLNKLWVITLLFLYAIAFYMTIFCFNVGTKVRVILKVVNHILM